TSRRSLVRSATGAGPASERTSPVGFVATAARRARSSIAASPGSPLVASSPASRRQERSTVTASFSARAEEPVTCTASPWMRGPSTSTSAAAARRSPAAARRSRVRTGSSRSPRPPVSSGMAGISPVRASLPIGRLRASAQLWAPPPAVPHHCRRPSAPARRPGGKTPRERLRFLIHAYDLHHRGPRPEVRAVRHHRGIALPVGYLDPMTPLSTITVSSDLPDALAPLRELALNLRWTWRRQTADLFRSLDPQVFVEAGENPVAMLPRVPAGRLAEASRDEAFLSRMRCEVEDLRVYLDSARWFQRTAPGPQSDDTSVAYFSMEFGITPTLPIYSGGLGILAGDHLKSASDLGVPLTGVGLLYQWGYFSQSLDRSGWRQEDYRLNEPSQLPIAPVQGADGEQLTVRLTLPGAREVAIAVWRAQVGRVPLLLLDTDVGSNDAQARQITDRLYGGDHEHRILQEIVLGIGGVRAVEAYSALVGAPAPTVFHLNEGHAGFSG